MKYLQKRQNPLSQCPTEDVERTLAKIVEYFDERWLKLDSGKHPLQLLWSRRDALSTNELFTFGTALSYAEQASAKWLAGQIKLVFGKDENNQRGAIFEILVVGAAAPMQEVTPASASQPGFDADIKTKQGTNYRTSLKRYSQSTHERLFRSKAAIAEKKFIKKIA